MSTIITEDKHEIKRYLLGQLGEADEERLELRLLTDPSFGEEFDTVVDEITDQYVGHEFEGEERERVEKYFLRSNERRQKVQFANELLQRAAAEGRNGHATVSSSPGIFKTIRAFLTGWSFSMRTATALATILIVVGVGYVIWPRQHGAGTYAQLTLQMSTSDRGGGAEAKTTQLADNAGIRIELNLRDQTAQAGTYRVELLDEQQQSRNLSITERTDRSLIVTIPANEISRGSYIIHLYADEQRIRGSYHFNVQ